MILQALYDYYQRKALDPESGIAPEGFEWKDISFVVVINRDGKFIALEDTREGEGKKRRTRSFLVPAGEKRASGIKANLLWDNIEYALGANPRGRDDAASRHLAFRNRLITNLIDHPDRDALIRFLDSNPILQIEASSKDANIWKEMCEVNANSNVVFRIDGSESTSICETLASSIVSINSSSEGICLILGKKSPISQLHPAIKGVRDAQPAGGAISSFNLSAFRSYGKEQNKNAPISNFATFAYTTALNMLLSRDSKNKVQVGDATTVFWSDKKTSLEEDFFSYWSVSKDDPDRDIKAVETLLKSPYTGSSLPNEDARFFVLGLSPNAARVSVRFWHTGTVADFSENLQKYFKDLEIVKPNGDKGSYALFFLLSDIALQNKIENIPPNLAGNVMRSILTGGPFPTTLLQQVVRRIRANREVKRTQASLLKGCLNRKRNIQLNSIQQEITMALDSTNTNPGYRLGRLFAALEKIQEDAQPGINATIRDRFYGAASSSPVSVFPQLLKLKNHHLAKLENHAFRGAHEKRLGEIFGGMLPDMPSHLSMEDQARFAIGYYHQRQAFFTKSEKPEQPTKEG